VKLIRVNVTGYEVTIGIRECWQTLAPVITAARWLAGCGELPFGNFEVRDETGRLLDPFTVLGDWFNDRTLYVNYLAGIA
jgi:hypothetical protein